MSDHTDKYTEKRPRMLILVWNTTWFFQYIIKVAIFSTFRIKGMLDIIIFWILGIHIILYLATSWTDLTIWFVTWYPGLSMPRFLSLFITTHITQYTYDPKMPTGHQ